MVEIEYGAARYEGRAPGSIRRVVHPYLIEPSTQTHALYLIGLDEERAGLRTFKIERIRAVTVTPRTFEPPEAGSVEALLRRAWDIIADQPAVTVALRFRAAVADRVGETIWHPSQETAVQPDGSLLWRATVSGTIEIRLWILSWGDDVEVLEPSALREDVGRDPPARPRPVRILRAGDRLRELRCGPARAPLRAGRDAATVSSYPMAVPPRTSSRLRPVPRVLVLAVLAAALLSTGLTPLHGATPTSASTATTMAGQILSKINAARQGHGLGALRTNSRLTGLASQRATKLAGLEVLSHDAPGCLTCQLADLGVSYGFMGEVLASNSYPWGTQSASVIFSSWKGSPEHWDILMTARVDSIGIAVAESASGCDLRQRDPDRRPRRDRAATLEAAGRGRQAGSGRPSEGADRRGTGDAGSARGEPDAGPDPLLTVTGQPFAAVNLISDPIHGYVELTKRLAPDEAAAAGLPPEEAAEDDLLDTAWVQRLRRISQLQSARWVFPTAEHSRFTHGLGVMHEAGLWARSLYPTMSSAMDGEPLPSEGLVVETLRIAGLLHDVGHGPFAHYFDDRVLADFPAPPDARRPGVKSLSHEDLSQLIIERELGLLIGSLRRAPGNTPARDAFADGRVDRPSLGLVPRLQAGPRRSDDAALGAHPPAAAVGGLHRRQPRLRSPRRVLHGRPGRASTSSGCDATRTSGPAA